MIHPGSEFVGKWYSVDRPTETFEITPNGDQFLITMHTHNFAGMKIGATYTNGGLELSTNRMKLTYIKETDSLIWPDIHGTGEWKRQK